MAKKHITNTKRSITDGHSADMLPKQDGFCRARLDEYESLQKLLEVNDIIDQIIGRPDCTKDKDQSTQLPSQDWDFNAGYNSSIELLKNGWSDGTKQVQELQASLESQDVLCAGWTNGTDPMVPLVPAFLAGQPDYWLNPDEDNAVLKVGNKTPVVNIAVDVAASCNWKADQFFNRGTALISIVKTIEAKGQRVNLYVCLGQQGDNHNQWLNLIKIKDADAPMDLDRLASILIHPAFFRRVIFRAIECNEFYKMPDGYGRGMPRRETLAQLKRFKPDFKISLLSSFYSAPYTFSTLQGAFEAYLSDIDECGLGLELNEEAVRAISEQAAA